MDKIINLKSKFNKTYLYRLKPAKNDAEESKTFLLVTNAIYVSQTRVKGGNLSIEPDGGPVITENELLGNNIVKSIVPHNDTFVITFE